MALAFPRACILFDVRSLDGFAELNFLRIKHAVRDTCDMFAVCHADHYVPLDDDVILLDDKAIFQEIEHAKTIDHGLIPGNCDLKFARACREVPDYDLVLWWEYDVVCASPIRQTVERFLETACEFDLSASYITDLKDDDWMWWDSFAIPHMTRAQSRLIAHRAFLPLFGASRRLIERYTSLLAQGWQGHAEVMIPTAARFLELNSVDISAGETPFTHYPQFGIMLPRDVDKFRPDFLHPVKSEIERLDLLHRAPATPGTTQMPARI